MAEFKLVRVRGINVSKDELIEDLLRVARLLGSNKMTQRAYAQHGQYDPSTISRRFGSWNDAVVQIGLIPANEIDIGDERLFENIMTLWEHYGRQPRKSELASPPSKISEGPYRRRFVSWMSALGAFVDFANSQELSAPSGDPVFGGSRTPRFPSLRLRFKVLKRDNFSCAACGASPSKQHGLSLHVDHIVPWSLGGLTHDANLQTLCEKCNLGKSNVL
mgnify:CR=1 FL=1